MSSRGTGQEGKALCLCPKILHFPSQEYRLTLRDQPEFVFPKDILQVILEQLDRIHCCLLYPSFSLGTPSESQHHLGKIIPQKLRKKIEARGVSSSQ